MLAKDQKIFQPREAHHLEEIGLSLSLMLDLILKYTYFEGAMTLAKLAQRSKLSSTIIHSMYRHLQKEQLCETRAMVGDDYEISLSTKGRNMADVALKKSHYAGPAPVPLADYNRSVSAQALQLDLTAESLKSALSDLVVPEHVIKELGAALMTGGAVLLYGSTGNGKTSIAERLPRIFEDDLIYVPHALEVAGQIISVYDTLVHRTETATEDHVDPRWVQCRRPMVKVGGEMRADMLDTRMDEVTRMCTAPIQMKANNGILLIDDFGRQRITPRELLNRWIVPMDRRTDILSLWSGITFEIPFELVVVFGTNLPLSDLAEDAFMRRLKNKIKIEPLSQDLFNELLRRVCEQEQLPCNPEMEEYISRECLKQSPEGLRACFPADLMKIIRGIAAFEKRTPSLEKHDVDEALKVYFVH
jgi:predicted ATPase with chaperone activity